MRFSRSFFLIFLLWSASSTAGAQQPRAMPTTSETRLAVMNSVLTGAFALGRGAIEGEVESWSDAVRTFGIGAAGGYGFYQAKRVAGHHSPVAGLALGYASASVVENAAQGRHPLSHVRFGLGGVDVRVRTPLAVRAEGPTWALEMNALWMASFVVLWPRSNAMLFQNGVVGHMLPDQNGRPVGSAIGRLVVLHEGYERHSTTVVSHETVHVIQSLQVGAVTPYYRLSQWLGGAELRLGRAAWDVQLDWLYGALGFINMQVPYTERWSEIEAYTFAPPRQPRGRWHDDVAWYFLNGPGQR